MTTPQYSARVLWHCPDHEQWELETAHSGFDSPESAALFANAVEHGPEALYLLAGKVTVLLTDGTRLADCLPPRAWRLPDGSPDVAYDRDFAEVEASPQELSRIGLDGFWEKAGYAIDGPGGPVDVVINAADDHHLLAKVSRDPSDGEPDYQDDPLLALLPRR